MDNQNKNWFALYTRVNQEFKTAEKLDKLGIEYYLPTITKIRQWSDRKKKITEPVLKNYIFIYATETERMDALVLPTVVRCISENGRPAVIPEWQIENFKSVINNKAEFLVHNGLVKGALVEIISGPFKGVRGIIQRNEKDKLIFLNIDLLNRSLALKINGKFDFKVVS